MTEPHVEPFDLGDLPDKLTCSEAFWALTALSYTYALGLGYLTLLDDRKAAYNPEKAAEYLERAVRRAFPAGEAEFLIQLARKKAREGVDRQREAQTAA